MMEIKCSPVYSPGHAWIWYFLVGSFSDFSVRVYPHVVAKLFGGDLGPFHKKRPKPLVP